MAWKTLCSELTAEKSQSASLARTDTQRNAIYEVKQAVAEPAAPQTVSKVEFFSISGDNNEDGMTQMGRSAGKTDAA